MQPASDSKCFRFSDFELKLRTGELFRNGAPVRLHEKPFQLLSALLERPGDVVLREELRHRLWSADTYVDFDNNLNAAVRKLRAALGDSADRPRFIETLPRRGYRFIAPVEATEPAVTEVAPEAGPPSRSRSVPLRRATVVAVLMAAVATVAWVLQGPRQPVAAPPAGKIVLAVLPFKNLDGDPSRDFFGAGMTEELIAQLGRLQPDRLGVIARLSSMSYRDTDKPADAIGRELGADYILAGSVRGPGDRVRVSVQLVQVSDQTHLWTETYDRSFADILDVQADIARRVAGSLALELLPEEPLALARAATSVTAAYEQFLRGRHEWQRFQSDGYRRAIAHFEKAIALDPTYPQAYAGLADAYNLLAFDGSPPVEAFPRAREAAMRALELNPDLAEAHNSIGFVRLYHDYDLTGAEAAFRRSIEISPNYAMAYHWYAGALSAQGRHDEAIEAVRVSLRLDPVSMSVMSDLGWYYLFADRPEEALAECEATLAIQPGYGWARSCRDQALVELGRLDEFLAHWLAASREEGADATLLDRIEAAGPDRGYGEVARLRLARAQDGSGDPVWRAMPYAAAGEIEGALDLLEEGLAARNPWMVFLRVDPRFDPLAQHPRFERLAGQIGLAPTS